MVKENVVAVGKIEIINIIPTAVRAEMKGIRAGSTGHYVVAKITRQVVIARITKQLVISLPAKDRIVSVTAMDDIVSEVSIHVRVITIVTKHGVVALAPTD